MEMRELIILTRRGQNLSTNKLAKLAGISQSTLREIEIGNSSPSVKTLKKIAKILKLTASDFLKCDEDDKIFQEVKEVEDEWVEFSENDRNQLDEINLNVILESLKKMQKGILSQEQYEYIREKLLCALGFKKMEAVSKKDFVNLNLNVENIWTDLVKYGWINQNGGAIQDKFIYSNDIDNKILGNFTLEESRKIWDVLKNTLKKYDSYNKKNVFVTF